MEDRAEEVQAAAEAVPGVSPSPEKRIPRRRFVQSTLFPHKSPEKSEVGDCAGAEAGGDAEECCGSQGKGKRKRTPGRKTAPQPRRSKKIAQNGKVASQEATDERDSSAEGSPYTPKGKQRASSRARRINGTKAACSKKLSLNTAQSDQITHSVPDLRLEAKKTAEEDSRRFAGKQLHPFFSSLKMGKKNQETTNAETGQQLADKPNKNVECGPIHVYGSIKDDTTSVDWSNWTFHDGINTCSTFDKCNVSSAFKGSVGSLQLDNILDVPKALIESHLNCGSVVCEDVADKPTESSEHVHNVVEPCHLSKNIEDCNVARLNFGTENSSCLRSNVEQDNSTSHESLPYCINRANQPQNSLWTYKYQPEKAIEVCGNVESVKLINEWLHLWRERDLWNCKQLKSDKCSQQEGYSSYDVDSDVESSDEDTGLKNVLLVIGPVGSGKSATIYACAKEQGFEVIEVNSSDWRSGALVKQKFGEAVGLHWLKGTSENPKGSQSMLKGKSFIPTPNTGAADDESKDDLNKLTTLPNDDPVNGDPNKSMPVADDETANGVVMMSQRSACSESTNIRDISDIKTLILFEEVDATLSEDRGFLATIQQLAQIAKRPMILTSNCYCPSLPDTLAREAVYFTMPSQKELLRHVCMVCHAEKSKTDPRMIEKYIQYCQGDVRKTLMHLQFWCQGQQCNTDCKSPNVYSPLTFDIEAGHKILPKIFPWGFLSELSEHVEMEIAKCSCSMEQSPVLIEVSEKVKEACTIDEHGVDGEMICIEAKKQAILSRNFANHDNELIVPPFNGAELSNSSGSPVAFSRRSTRKKQGLVLFDSEDDISNHNTPGKPENSFKGNGGFDLNVLAVGPESQTNWPTVDGFFHPSLGDLAGNKLAESWNQRLLAANVNNGICYSGEVSCVPESTFVPETEVGDGTEFSARADQTEVESPAVLRNLGKPALNLNELPEPTESACDVNLNLADYETGDSQNECENLDGLTRNYQVLDECSRMHFRRGPRRLKKCISNVTANPVQETWKQLRCADLKQQITNEDKNASQAMRLASRMCNLIAEADILLHDCEILTTESADTYKDLIEDSFTCGWHENQLHMASVTTEHGFCVFAKGAVALGSRIGFDSRVDITGEMLASTSNSMALGKLLRRDRITEQTSVTRSEELAEAGASLERDREESFRNIVYSVVPPKCYLATRGATMNDYLSILAHMSRSDANRASESPDNTRRRRKRVLKNYLSSSSLSLPPAAISALLGYSSSWKLGNNKQRSLDYRSVQYTRDP